LLAGVPHGNGQRAVWFFPGTNIDASPTRYTMDPLQVIEAMKRMREEQWDLAAIVHSHPRSQPAPSRTDRNEWYYPEARLLIVSFMDADPLIGCWGLVGDRQSREFHAAPLVIQDR
jgi:proteasome lid subunit RPN8/RPN11